MKRWWWIAIALGAVAACAGSNALEQRVAALESRVNELESDAGAPHSEPDASAVSVDASSEALSERHRLSWRPTLDAGWDTGGPRGATTIGMGPLLATSLEDCLERARDTCAVAATRATRVDGGTFTWRRDESNVKPEDNAQGRACLATENAKCKADPIHNNPAAKLKRWLDQQLTAKRIDKAASAELTRLIRERAQASSINADNLEVLCAPEFCRVSGGDDDKLRGNLANVIEGYPATEVLRFGLTHPVYIARDRWRFPYSPK